MLMRVLRRIVYFGIPVMMWFAGAACVANPPQVQQVRMVTYRCSRVGCDKTAEGGAGGAVPTCSCGSSMVLDSNLEPPPRLSR